MYGNGQVLMSASNTSMGVAPENVMSSSDHHNHHHHNHHQFFMSSPIRNPNSFNFMSAASALPSFHPFPSLIPKEEGGGGYMGLRKEDMDSMSGGEQLELDVGGGMTSANELDVISNHHLSDQDAAFQPGVASGSKKKRYHRHTAHQIQEMEALFKECPHPDDKQRLKLSQELGLKPRQVKFWFQNRRTQMKAQQDRSDNAILRTENDGLKTENYRLQALMRSLMCPTCGGASLLGEVAFDEQQLRLENARLKDELDRLCNIASRYSGRNFQSMGPPHASPPPHGLLPPSLDLDMGVYSRHFQEPSAIPPSCSDHGMVPMPFLPHPDQHPAPHHSQPFQCGVLLLDEERSLAMDLALSSLDELVKMCQTDEPLWLRSLNNNNVSVELLDSEEHSRMFPWAMSAKQHYNVECCRTEATRHSTLVIMNSLNLVDAFLDADKWVELFPSIVSRAKTLQIVASGVSGHASGSLHLMYAELQVLSPLVPTRETFFLRYFHHNAEAGIWSIVDFPIDNFQCASALQPSLPRYRRRPSGCTIQDMPNGYSKVTWVEHAEVLEEKPVHEIFNQYVNSSMAFGAQRWLAILQRQCERVASQMARNISNAGEVIQSPEARKNLMRLAQRMISMFCTNISTTGGQSWTAVSDSVEDTVRITTRKVTEPGQPNGVILGGVSTTWLPYPHDQVFNLLKNEHKRSQLESLSNGYSLQEIAHIANGSDPGNCISLLRTNVASNSSQNVDLMLQESCTDSSGSLIVYTTVEVNYIQLVMSGEDPSCIPLLPLGFSIIPFSMNEQPRDPPSDDGGPQREGCLLTVGLQALASTIPTTKLCLSSVKAINSHLCSAVSQINAALSSNTNICNNAVPPSSPPADAKPTPPTQ